MERWQRRGQPGVARPWLISGLVRFDAVADAPGTLVALVQTCCSKGAFDQVKMAHIDEVPARLFAELEKHMNVVDDLGDDIHNPRAGYRVVI
jgi:hypothetical protein